jgi:hypothetical protein
VRVANLGAHWHGNNYQSRIFWQNALSLLLPGSCVAEVTFEADGPKAFDDVVVVYDPAISRSGPLPVPADYHQVKWHVERGGRFGYADLIVPKFIGAERVSLLENLRDAKRSAPSGANFTFLTTYRIIDGDPLAAIISGNDHSLLLPRLFDGTGPKSRMGRVRKLWRDHLGLADDDELRVVLDGFRIIEGYRSLEELRAEINFRAQAVGVLACHASDSDFRFDELARQLKTRQLNRLTRRELEELCRREGLLDPAGRPVSSKVPVAICSFVGAPADSVGSPPQNTLILTDAFNERYLKDGQDWQADILPRVKGFIQPFLTDRRPIRLSLDAHASIAYLAGSILDLKSGVEVDLVQRSRVGTRVWRADDGQDGDPLIPAIARSGDGGDVALLLSLTHDVEAAAIRHLKARDPAVGAVLSCSPPGGPSQQSLAGGTHAARLADQITSEIRKMRDTFDGTVHIFAACPNALLYFLGQQHRGIGPAIIYEFDFDRRGDKGYHPSFLID